MKDFDEARALRSNADREFKIGGELFVRKASVRPEVLFAYEDMTTSVGAAKAMEIMDETLVAFIEGDDAKERYDAMRARTDDAVTVGDLSALLAWLISETTGRPISAPLPSTDGHVRTRATTPSTDDSPAPALAAV